MGAIKQQMITKINNINQRNVDIEYQEKLAGLDGLISRIDGHIENINEQTAKLARKQINGLPNNHWLNDPDAPLDFTGATEGDR